MSRRRCETAVAVAFVMLVLPRASSAGEDAGKKAEPAKDAAQMTARVVEEQKKAEEEAERKKKERDQAEMIAKLRVLKVRLLKKPFVRFVAVSANLKSLPSGKDGDDAEYIYAGDRVEVLAEKAGYFGIRRLENEGDDEPKKKTKLQKKPFDESDIVGWVKKKDAVSATEYKRIARQREFAQAKAEARDNARADRENARKAKLARTVAEFGKRRRSLFLSLNGVPGGCYNIRSTPIEIKNGVAWSEFETWPRSVEEGENLEAQGLLALYNGFCEHGAKKSAVFARSHGPKVVAVRCWLAAGYPPGACAVMNQGKGEAVLDGD